MVTAKELRAKSYGLRGYSTLRKPGLIRLIAEARAPVLLERAARWACYAFQGAVGDTRAYRHHGNY